MKKLLKTALILLLLALLTLAFLWCRSAWTWRSLSYHESWTHEQRADLQELADTVSELYDETKHTKHSKYMVEAYAMLREVARSGRAEAFTPSTHCSAAYLAAVYAKMDLLRELTRRGADLNLPTTLIPKLSPMTETPFQAAIHPFIRSVPIAQRLEMLEFMLAHGADIQKGQKMPSFIHAYASAKDGDKGAMLEWLLEHGLTPDSERELDTICAHLHHPGTLPVIQRLVEKKLLNTDSADIGYALLTAALISAPEDRLEKLRWVLSLGVDPNYRPEHKPGDLPESPALNIALRFLARASADEAPDLLQALDILFRHGARPTQEPGDSSFYHEDGQPSTPELREAYKALLDKYGLELPQKIEQQEED